MIMLHDLVDHSIIKAEKDRDPSLEWKNKDLSPAIKLFDKLKNLRNFIYKIS